MHKFVSLAAFCLALTPIAKAEQLIKIDGSSTVYPVTEAVAEEFQKANPAMKVTVGISGTGGGFKKFCRGETDIQDASRPIQKGEQKPGEKEPTPGEMENCNTAGIKYYELPIGFDATAIVVHKDNKILDKITVAELKKMWEPEAKGKIMAWKDVNPKWPDQPLKLYGAGTDSGTFDYFTEAIVGKAKASRDDYNPSEDDNVLVQGVSSNKNALGYLPYAYYEENKAKLKLLAVVNPKTNKPESPARATVESGTYAPLSRPLFIYVNEASLKRAEVKNFVEFYLNNAARLVPQVKYVPLPKEAYAMAMDHLKKAKLGTAFGGHSQVGMKIQDLMKREKTL